MDFNLGFGLAFGKSIFLSPHSGSGPGSDLHTQWRGSSSKQTWRAFWLCDLREVKLPLKAAISPTCMEGSEFGVPAPSACSS